MGLTKQIKLFDNLNKYVIHEFLFWQLILELKIHLLIGRTFVTIWGSEVYVNNKNLISNDKQAFPIHLVTQNFPNVSMEATLIFKIIHSPKQLLLKYCIYLCIFFCLHV